MSGSELVVVVDDGNFTSEVIRHSGVVLVDFGAEWCGPCKTLKPFIMKLAEQHKGKLKVCLVDVGGTSNTTDIAMKHSVTSVPTVVFYKNGELKERIVGADVAKINSRVIELIG